MAARSVWKGFINFSLVAVPVKAYTASNSGSQRIALNQLHKECNSRINYKKTCPVHDEVPSDQIVSGYEFSDGQYVVVDPDEIEKLRPAKEKSINISAFLRPDALDSNYLSGKNYYLLPDGPVAFKPYALLKRIMSETNRAAFAQMVFQQREQVVMVRPVGNILGMTLLSYDAEVRKPSEFDAEAPKVEVSPEELKLARTLIETLAVDEFDFSQFKDKYNDRLRELIELKIKGQEVVAPPAEEAPQVINLMEALQKSLDEAKKASKPPKLAAGGTASKVAASRKRKQA
jgi:DNA end-binding protein Ku